MTSAAGQSTVMLASNSPAAAGHASFVRLCADLWSCAFDGARSSLRAGTAIAGAAASKTVMTGCDAVAVGIRTLINAVLQMMDCDEVAGEQICRISSSNMDAPTLFKIAKRVNELIAGPNVDGVVITHGTDTIEETAYSSTLS